MKKKLAEIKKQPC